MEKTLEPNFLKRTRMLTQALIISGALNIGLLSTFCYFIFQEDKESLDSPARAGTVKMASLTNQEVFKSYASLPFDDLLLRLANKEHVEDGLAKRDLALAALASMHHLDVEKALGGSPYERKEMLYRLSEEHEPMNLNLYLGLNESQFQSIENYVKTEKWPLTSKGLFLHLKHAMGPKDAILHEAFYLTSVFENIYNIFQKTGHDIPKEELVEIIVSGDWAAAEAFGKSLDFSIDHYRKFLVKYAIAGSRTAAKRLVEQEGDFVSKKLEDSQLSRLFDLCMSDPKSLETLAQDVMKSFRSEQLRRKAGITLYTLAKEPIPEPYDHAAALRRFFPNLVAEVPKKEKELTPVKGFSLPIRPTVSTTPSHRYHTVQEGDSLWKISRKYKVDVEALMKANHLESEKLKVGKKLVIPEMKKTAQGTGS